MMEYKGYFAKVEFIDDDNIFHGEIINLRDVITFEGETVKELKQAFKIQLTIIWIFANNAEKILKNHTRENLLYVLNLNYIRILLLKLEKREKV